MSVLARGGARLRRIPGAIPPAGLVFLSIVSVQVGAAFAKGLFAALGSQGTVFLRLGFAALFLLAMWRPRVRGYQPADYRAIIVFGLVFATMNSAFYASLERVPLGVAVTVEFVGPLAVAVFGSRRIRDLIWALLAAAGLLLLSPIGGTTIDPLGLALALLAGGCWAAYILVSVRVGRTFPGGSGLALGMVVGALVVLPAGVWQGGATLLDGRLLVTGAGVALLSSVIPYSLELEALRKMAAPVFGVLLSSEPAIAALTGFVMLGEPLGVPELVAIILLTVASIGATVSSSKSHRGVDAGPTVEPPPQ
ncbi:MAG TPA: EamA family transporter [Chloroflexia bacterium]|nr:EamA family transporter [Chloroflexia bacterium]